MPTEKHANNFDFLRLLLASFVIITHSYPLTGREEHDWLYQITNGQTLFSYIAVRGFFAISGYLIFQSMLQSKNIINYYWKRFLRIFPGLFIVLLLSSAFCYFAYTEGGGRSSYWNNLSTYTYLPKNLILFFGTHQASIEGVFLTNRYATNINGSLWTIRMELFAYLLISVLFLIRKNKTLLFVSICFTTLYLQIMAPFFVNRGEKF